MHISRGDIVPNTDTLVILIRTDSYRYINIYVYVYKLYFTLFI